jgi:mannosylfructose-phosphate synthase
MVAIEAMACGTPTIITVHGGLFELIDFGKLALYANPNRPIESGTRLAFPMLYPDLAHQLSVEGARFARRNFGWTTTHPFSCPKTRSSPGSSSHPRA